MDVIAESVTEVTYMTTADGSPELWDFALGFDNTAPETASNEHQHLPSTAEDELADEELTVVWMTPDWEEDWISELLGGGGVQFRLIKDTSFNLFPRNALIAVSQNDQRNRPAEVLAKYLLGFRSATYGPTRTCILSQY